MRLASYGLPTIQQWVVTYMARAKVNNVKSCGKTDPMWVLDWDRRWHYPVKRGGKRRLFSMLTSEAFSAALHAPSPWTDWAALAPDNPSPCPASVMAKLGK